MASVTQQLGRLRYGVEQSARVAWFAAHYAAARRRAGPLTKPGEPPLRTQSRAPKRDELLRAIVDLFAQDRLNVEAGLYAASDGPPNPKSLFEKSRAFLADMREVDRRRLDKVHDEVRETVKRDDLPNYYLQNFHFQSGGWLSEESARLYDFQVETLFGGTASAMRRQALAPLARAIAGRDQRSLSLLDVAAGTGSFAAEIKRNWPLLKTTLLDLSPDYLAKARETLRGMRGVEFVEGNAERMGFADATFDLVTCVYLFHELPPKIRPVIAAEIARVVKPGGTLVLVDSLQTGDTPEFDGLLEAFPKLFHEPYYGTYLTLDFAALFKPFGLECTESKTAFLSKVVTFTRAAARSPRRRRPSRAA